MDLITLARELGFAIQNDDDYVDYRIKEQNVECDKELQNIIEKFNLKKTDINYEISKENPDNEKIDKLNEEIGILYNEMTQNENMKSYNEIKSKFSKKLAKVSRIINESAQGKDPYLVDVDTDESGGCGGSCSSCSGCM